jgi:competence protein ComEA
MTKLLRTLVLALALPSFAALAAGPVDVNTADATTLEQVKGIGPVKANAIVAFRTANGPFTSIDQLVRVPGIGEKTLQQLRDRLTVSKPE